VIGSTRVARRTATLRTAMSSAIPSKPTARRPRAARWAVAARFSATASAKLAAKSL